MTDDERDRLLLEIKRQTTLTNGRMTHMEAIVEGDPATPLPSGERDRGLVGMVHDQGVKIAAQEVFIGDVRRLVTVGKRVALAFGAAALGLFGNLAAGLLS